MKSEAMEDLDVSSDVFKTGSGLRTVKLLRFDGVADSYLDEVAVTDVDGDEIFEGDIVLSSGGINRQITRGLSIRHGNGTWPGGIVYFVCADPLRTIVNEAIGHWETKTPVRFRTGIGGGSFVSFEDHGVCQSVIGRQENGQVVKLKLGCTVGDVIHEIGHVLGLWHEQSRSDRDAYIRILEENIRPGEAHNFDPQDGSAVNRGTYDLESIMHYPSNAFSSNGPTILTIGGQAIPPRNGLSQGDVAAIRELYPDLSW